MNHLSPELNDSLDDLLGRVGTQTELAAAPRSPRPAAAPASNTHSEPCPKCRGTGRFGGYSRHGSHCFACQGKGQLTFKSAPEARAKARATSAARKAKRAQEAAQEARVQADLWFADNQEAGLWIEAHRGTVPFAQSMYDAVHRWGHLTDNQLAAVWRSIERDAERTKERAAQVATAPSVDTGALKAAFDAAAARAAEKGLSLKYPKITVGKVVISPAGASSRNPGALYVKDAGTYVGKIQDGKFLGTRECTPEVTARVLAFIADPKGSAKAYGIETGICCICGAELKSKWKFEGIGPICATKFGW